MRRLCIIVCLSLASVPSLAAEPCPESIFVVGNPEVTIASTQPQRSECRAGRNMMTGNPSGTGCASYNLVTGSVESTCSVGGNHSNASGSVRAVDEYRVIAATPGQAVTFTARLTYSMAMSVSFGGQGGYGEAEVRLTNGEVERSDVLIWSFGCPGNLCERSGVLEIEISTTTGTPFQLALTARTVASASAPRATGQLSFVGLPVGFTVESCQRDGPTAAASTTWGRLKAIYR